MKNSSSSYIKGINRAPASVGKFYAIDVVENCKYRNPVREHFEYKVKTQQTFK